MNGLSTDTIAIVVYEQGALRLLKPLSLPEHSRVRLVIRQIDATDELRQAE